MRHPPEALRAFPPLSLRCAARAGGRRPRCGAARPAQAKAPLQRLVKLDEIAQLSAFLCMEAASGMTGQTIYVDAGVHAMD